jgi:membrane protease YdiL (CAAX protease family)
VEVVSAFVIAPLVEEAIFRAGSFRLAASLPAARGGVALGSAVAFGLMHKRFGRRFVGYAFVGGLVLNAAYARTGYWGAVVLHASANVADLSLGWRRYLHETGSR